ncbi:hypothetical protein [Desulfitobacterium metallireducens]|uniref:Lipoprotein n=1 Tax=Desulfitobacterium metallireducens DSM 15288 TaxID=871968 RepID=W0EHS6_9FIRM|nr:hypothetical protein [Desulfitobacterium metallireducens]AHF08626.1 hypothetical protein DESME_10365 [Desulfitobacterium metallireducens DSM 15288]
MIKRISIVMIIILSIILTGCGSELNRPVSGISQEATESISKVSRIYGESKPQIITVKRTETEVTKEMMYIVFVKGKFQNGDQKASNLEFSVLASGKSVWALRPFNDDNNQDVWEETSVNINDIGRI